MTTSPKRSDFTAHFPRGTGVAIRKDRGVVLWAACLRARACHIAFVRKRPVR